MKEALIKEKVLGILSATLKEIPFITVQRAQEEVAVDPNMRIDASIEIGLGEGAGKLLLIEIKNNGQPRVVREAINQLYRLRVKFPNAYGIVAAPYISPDSARLCSAEGIGHMDLAGNCLLSFEKVYLCKEGIKNPFAEKRDLRSLFSPRAARVVRVVLNDPGRPWKVQTLANEARVSIGQASNVKKLLKDREWISEGENGFSLVEPAKLLKEWSGVYSFRKNEVHDFYSLEGITAIEQNLAALCFERKIPFALTGFSGAARWQPGLRYQRLMAYIGIMDKNMIEEIGLKEVTTGANVSMLLPYDEGVFYGAKDVNGISVASPVQVYLDLANYKGRGEEAARTIYERILEPSWR